MTRSVCGYRIYPAWFGGEDMAHAPIVELAYGTAERTGQRVVFITVTGHGTDRRRGEYIDFDVTYSPITGEMKAREARDLDARRAEDAARSRRVPFHCRSKPKPKGT
jgi:hypothetical protein